MSKDEKSGLEGLFDNKLVKYLGTYLAVGFGILQFIDFAEGQYNLGNHWIDRFLLIWITLLPALFILLYFGNKKSGQLSWPKYAVATNIALSFVLGFFLVTGHASDAVEIVEVTNEEGQKVQTVVPSLNKIKSLASFQMENATGDAELDWWGIALGNLLQLDLDQRPEFYSRSPYGMFGYYEGMGLKDFKLPSVGMLREMAQKGRSDYFTRLSYDIVDEEFVIDGKVYATVDGKSVMDLEVRDEDPFVAIDQLKQEISEKIPDALEALEQEESLPASSLITNNPKALEYYTKGRIANSQNPNGNDDIIRLMKLAIEEDPSCGRCYYYLGLPLYNQGKQEESISALQSAVRFSKSLPERMQFEPKETLYGVTSNIDAYINLLEMRRKMFPYDFSPYEQLQLIYLTNYGIDSTKQLMQEAINNGNVERGLLAMYGLQLRDEDYSGAEKSLDQLKADFPDRDQDRLKYAQIYEFQGRLDEARTLLEEEATLDPFNASIQTRLALIDFRNEELKGAHERLEKGLAESMTLSDSTNYIFTKRYLLAASGQVDKALSFQNMYEAILAKQQPMFAIIAQNFGTKVDMHLSVGDQKSSREIISNIATFSPESTGLYKCICKAQALQRNYQFDGLDIEFSTCIDNFSSYGEGYKELFEAMKACDSNDYTKAAEILDGDDGRLKNLFHDKTFIAEVYNRAGRNDEAREFLQKEVDKKAVDPLFYLEMAHLLEGYDPSTARAHIEKALRYWEDADAAFIPKQRAEELLARLN